MSDKISYDPALTKLWEVKREAEKLGLPETIISGLQAVEDLFEVHIKFYAILYCDIAGSLIKYANFERGILFIRRLLV